MFKPLAWLLTATLIAAPALAKEKESPAQVIKGAEAMAWSLKANQSEMIISVSPARQALQFLGSTGAIIGTSVSAIMNEKYGKQIMEALDGYDAGGIFQQRLTQRLTDAIGGNLKEVNALSSTAGYSNPRDAENARYESLGKEGHDYILDIKMSYGLYGYEGQLITKLDFDIHETPSGHRVYDDVLAVSSEPMLASDKLTDPTKMLSGSFSSPRLSVEEGAISQWTGDGGKILRTRFEQSVDGVISAMLTDLGLVDEVAGHYYLGQAELNRKKFDSATGHFNHALKLDPNYTPAKNGLSLVQAHTKQLDKAIATAQAILADTPEYGPAHYNLAWWYATGLKDAGKARPHYEKALALGYPKEKKVEKILNPKKK